MADKQIDNISDDECIDIMRQGGKEICEQALGKWFSPTYCPQIEEEFRKEHRARWKAISNRINDIAKKMKKQCGKKIGAEND